MRKATQPGLRAPAIRTHMFLGSLSQPLPPVDPVFAAMASLNIAKMVHRTQILLTETRLALRLKLGVC